MNVAAVLALLQATIAGVAQVMQMISAGSDLSQEEKKRIMDDADARRIESQRVLDEYIASLEPKK